MKIYAVHVYNGMDYEDRCDWIPCIFASLGAAQDYVRELERAIEDEKRQFGGLDTLADYRELTEIEQECTDFIRDIVEGQERFDLVEGSIGIDEYELRE